MPRLVKRFEIDCITNASNYCGGQGIITQMPHIVSPRIPLIGAHASRDPYVVGSFMVNVGSLSAPPVEQLRCCGSSSAWLDLTCDVPDKARELTRAAGSHYLRPSATEHGGMALRGPVCTPPHVPHWRTPYVSCTKTSLCSSDLGHSSTRTCLESTALRRCQHTKNRSGS
jgi:hypothetical protein